MRWNTAVINNKTTDLYLLLVKDVAILLIENIRFQSSMYVMLSFKNMYVWIHIQEDIWKAMYQYMMFIIDCGTMGDFNFFFSIFLILLHEMYIAFVIYKIIPKTYSPYLKRPW